MKKPLSFALIAVLLAVTLAACGGKPVAATEATTTTEVATTTEATTTTEIPTTTEATTTTTKTTTTQKPTSTTDIFQQYRDAINNSDMTDQEKQRAQKLLGNQQYRKDTNGVFYFERERWTEPKSAFGILHGFELSPGMIYDLPFSLDVVYAGVCVKFSYDGQDWAILMWKGRYNVVMLGGEIGVLKLANERDAYRFEQYLPVQPAEQLRVSMDVYQHNFENDETKHLFARSMKSAWWFNGFMPGSFHKFARRDEIIMVGTIAFPDQEMLKAFEKSFAAIGFKQGTPDSNHPETYSIKDNTLTFSWQYIDQG